MRYQAPTRLIALRHSSASSKITLAVLMGTLTLSAVQAEVVSNDALAACTRVRDDASRLACFDRATAPLRAGQAPPAPGAADEQPTATAPPAVDSAGAMRAPAPVAASAAATIAPAASAPAQRAAAVSAIDGFGLAPAAPPTAHTELKSITAHVVALNERLHAGALLELDNGQRWQQMGTEDLVLKLGDRVTISHGAFDSFWVVTQSNRSAHVRRVP